MSAHDDASTGSKELCDKLFECLQKRIPNLRRRKVTRWCALYQEGRNRFAYINHRKKMSRIEVWVLGDPDELQESTSLTVVPRQETFGGWGQRFQSRFFVDVSSEIDLACDLLFRISYMLS